MHLNVFLASIMFPSILPRFVLMSLPSKSFIATALLLLTALSGCVTPPPKKPIVVKKAQATTPVKRASYWKGDGVKGEPKIVIGLSEQRAYFYRGDTVVGESVVSTGKTGFETPVGEYQVIQKDKDHASTLYGQFVDAGGDVVRSNVDITKDKPPVGAVFKGAKMPWFLRFHDGYGLHAGRVPAHRASHGCVRLPRDIAMHFYTNVEVGTPVILLD